MACAGRVGSGRGSRRASPAEAASRAQDHTPRRRREIAHALEVPERAFALEARAAGDVDLRDLRRRRHRRRVRRRRRAEQRDQRDAHRGGRVHQPRVVADDDRGERQEVDRGAEIGAPGEIADRCAARRPPAASTASAASLSFGEPTSQTCRPSSQERRARARRNAPAASASRARIRRRGRGSRCAVERRARARARRRRDSRHRARAPARGGRGTSSRGATASAA